MNDKERYKVKEDLLKNNMGFVDVSKKYNISIVKCIQCMTDDYELLNIVRYKEKGTCSICGTTHNVKNQRCGNCRWLIKHDSACEKVGQYFFSDCCIEEEINEEFDLDDYIDKLDIQNITEIFDCELDDKESNVIKMKFGLTEDRIERDNKEIAKALNIREKTVSNILEYSIRRISHPRIKQLIKDKYLI